MSAALPPQSSPKARAAKKTELANEARRQWLQLKRLARNDEPLDKLLRHPFFAPLQAALPSNADKLPSPAPDRVASKKRKLSFSQINVEDKEESDEEEEKEEKEQAPTTKASRKATPKKAANTAASKRTIKATPPQQKKRRLVIVESPQ